jgi:hypothetical protein
VAERGRIAVDVRLASGRAAVSKYGKCSSKRREHYVGIFDLKFDGVGDRGHNVLQSKSVALGSTVLISA